MKRWSLATRLALSVVPIALIALIAGAYAVWTLVEVADGSPGPLLDVAIGEQTAFFISALALLLFIGAVWFAYSLGRSVIKRVQSVTEAATKVADVDLPNLVEALRNPHEDLAELPPVDLGDAGDDEIGDLSKSFQALHTTLIEVASQQMEILRKGVSDIFITLARRNRSLVDRQLALIDDLESREEDPEILGGYYKLDHFATRMRRNAESLLVLAGAEPPRVWAKPLELSEVIRGALGEVDDYQRIDVLAMEPSRLSGAAVTDVAHLVSELLDNATQYSPPTERVRVAGMFDPAGYLITISDNGLGMSDARIAELNRILEQPPALGLALEPTLGIYVVARLAARHGIKVVLIPGVTGITARITIPRGLLDVGQRARPGEGGGAADEGRPAGEAAPALDEEVSRDRGGQYVFRRNERQDVVPPPPQAEPPQADEPQRPAEEEPATRVRKPDRAPEKPGERREIEDEQPAPSDLPQRSSNKLVAPQDPESGAAEDALERRDLTSSEEMKALTERLARQTRVRSGPKPEASQPDSRQTERSHHEPGPPERSQPESRRPDAPVEEPRAQPANASLPVRTPGASYRADDDEAASSVTAEGAIGIRSALSAYEEGRNAASAHSESESDHSDHEGSDGQ